LLFQRYYCRESTLNFLRILLGSGFLPEVWRVLPLQAVSGYCCYLNIEKGYSDVSKGQYKEGLVLIGRWQWLAHMVMFQ
jgi:hypothetical protein